MKFDVSYLIFSKPLPRPLTSLTLSLPLTSNYFLKCRLKTVRLTIFKIFLFLGSECVAKNVLVLTYVCFFLPNETTITSIIIVRFFLSILVSGSS